MLSFPFLIKDPPCWCSAIRSFRVVPLRLGQDQWLMGVCSSTLPPDRAGTLEGKRVVTEDSSVFEMWLTGASTSAPSHKNLVFGSLRVHMLSALFPFSPHPNPTASTSQQTAGRNDALTSPIASSKKRNAIHWYLVLPKILPPEPLSVTGGAQDGGMNWYVLDRRVSVTIPRPVLGALRCGLFTATIIPQRIPNYHLHPCQPVCDPGIYSHFPRCRNETRSQHPFEGTARYIPEANVTDI